MRRKTILTGAVCLLLAAGCLLASCKTEEGTESEREGVSSSVSAESSFEGSSESSAESPLESSAESSVESSAEESSAPEALPDPLPEDLPGMDSPAPPAELHYYLPLEGHFYFPMIDPGPNLHSTITYRGNTMVIDCQTEYGGGVQDEYRLDDSGRLLEYTGEDWLRRLYHKTYAYDREGRLIELVETTEEQIWEFHKEVRTTFFYNEAGELTRKQVVTNDGKTTETLTYAYLFFYGEDGVVTKSLESASDGTYAETFYENGLRAETVYYTADGERRYSEFYSALPPEEMRLHDAYGRQTLGCSYSLYTVSSYHENGALCKVVEYEQEPLPEGGYEVSQSAEVTKWGDEAVTDLQLAFYRIAMRYFFGGWGVEAGEAFRTDDRPDR